MRKQLIFDKTGNHQINVGSGVKVFDDQVSCIDYGNVIGNTQVSFHIRPYSETECNGRVSASGHLRDWDLNQWRTERVPAGLRKFIESVTLEEGVWLYHFFHFGRRRYTPNWGRQYRRVEMVSDCWVVTDDAMRKVLKVQVTHPTRWDIGRRIADACIPFILETKEG